ncbi:hypothetical protein IVB40_22485 [Bradyrhizobium sp. 40]|uniref:hypothetical protein n=1 Tax=Bradyrhizobium sp. 40 TaxID=2782674 RepID=UPI0020004B0A|nr:hypothetical protein [Bradyrhizobium sp. 40]UPJ40085.1 hypothetical protein IVB40_22485 [Bradyrhizobium sp. 40]
MPRIDINQDGELDLPKKIHGTELKSHSPDNCVAAINQAETMGCPHNLIAERVNSHVQRAAGEPFKRTDMMGSHGAPVQAIRDAIFSMNMVGVGCPFVLGNLDIAAFGCARAPTNVPQR